MAAASVGIVMSASFLLGTSAGVAATAAPAAAIGLALSAERFHTVIVCPTSMSRCAMAAPILPIPAMPICIGRVSCGFFPAPPPRSTVAGDDRGLSMGEIALGAADGHIAL